MRSLAVVAIALALSAPTLSPAAADSGATAEDLTRQQETVEKHLLRVQQERFEAKARGDDPKQLRRLEREFRRTYGRRNAVLDAEKQLQQQ